MSATRHVTVAERPYLYRADDRLSTPTGTVLGHVERMSDRCWLATSQNGARTHHATRDSAFRWLIGGFEGIGIYFASAKTVLRAERARQLR